MRDDRTGQEQQLAGNQRICTEAINLFDLINLDPDSARQHSQGITWLNTIGYPARGRRHSTGGYE
jgi:hypothetical protein